MENKELYKHNKSVEENLGIGNSFNGLSPAVIVIFIVFVIFMIFWSTYDNSSQSHACDSGDWDCREIMENQMYFAETGR